MTLGMSLSTFTLVHVLISLLGIASGFVVLYGLITGKSMANWSAVFLASTVATSATGFLFPFEKLLPSHIIGILSLLVLSVAILARYGFRLAPGWRSAYVISSIVALYFNVFVLIVQMFRRIPFLKAIAPTQSEPPFFVAQLIVLAAFVYLAIAATKRFRNQVIRPAIG